MKDRTDRYRAAEAAAWASFGLHPREFVVPFGEDATALRVHEFGTGTPVLFIHGGSASGANWAQLVGPLTNRLPDHRLLLIDRPGCGLSEPAAFDHTVEGFQGFADGFVSAALDGLEIDRAHVVATSMGGHLAVRSAAAHPERIGRMVELAYCFGAEAKRFPSSMRIATLPGIGKVMVRIPPNRMAIKAILKQLGLGEAMSDGRLDDIAVDWFLSLMRDTPTMRNELAANPDLLHWRTGLNPDVRLDSELLQRITTPSLFVWSEGDPIGGAEVARSFTAQIPGARLELLDDPSHAPWLGEPDRCAELIADFLTA
jgi:pimeloyl-ACP methyl ester carboxylesterase